MRVAGFVLVGGQSRRMGQDKALLPWGSGLLLDAITGKVAAAAGNVALLGDRLKYGHFGYPVYPDMRPDCGPLGGLETALEQGRGDWNMLVACDLPEVSQELLDELVMTARSVSSGIDCVAPCTPDGEWQPLCALYHARSLTAVRTALARGCFKMKDLLPQLKARPLPVADGFVFANANTPEDWDRIRRLP